MSVIKATAVFMPNQNGIKGEIHFQQTTVSGYTLIFGYIDGLTPGLHGFHIHTEGANVIEKCKSGHAHACSTAQSGNCCDLLGGHYNPFNKNHGYPIDEERHVGDLGNVHANKKGFAEIRLKDYLIKLNGPYSVIGRSLIVHANTDDGGEEGTYESRTTGTSGPRLACAIIKLDPK